MIKNAIAAQLLPESIINCLVLKILLFMSQVNNTRECKFFMTSLRRQFHHTQSYSSSCILQISSLSGTRSFS